MKKRHLLFLCILVLAFAPFYSVKTSAKTMNTTALKKDYKTMMIVVKKAVLAGNSQTKIESLPQVKAFKQKYSDKESMNYLATKVINISQDKIDLHKQLNGSTLSDGQSKIISFADGTFATIQASSSTSSLIGKNTVSIASTNSESKSVKIHSNSYFKYQFDFWGFFKSASACVTTRFNVKSKSKLHIYDVDDAGTKSWLPTSIITKDLKPVINDGKTIQSKGTFEKVDGITLGSTPIGYTEIFDLLTTISIKSSTSSKVSVKATFKYVE